jgi:hypothetical protein
LRLLIVLGVFAERSGSLNPFFFLALLWAVDWLSLYLLRLSKLISRPLHLSKRGSVLKRTYTQIGLLVYV